MILRTVKHVLDPINRLVSRPQIMQCPCPVEKHIRHHKFPSRRFHMPFSAPFQGAAQARAHAAAKGSLAVALPNMKLFLVIPPGSEGIDFQNTREAHFYFSVPDVCKGNGILTVSVFPPAPGTLRLQRVLQCSSDSNQPISTAS